MLYTIKIDAEVYEFLKINAEPFLETTPNMVLRRLLLEHNNKKHLIEHKKKPVNTGKRLPHVKNGTNMSVKQILLVVYLVIVRGYHRTNAKNYVANYLGVTRETVHDKYTRGLGLTPIEVDKYLTRNNIQQFFEILILKYPGQKYYINEFIENHLN